MRPETTAELEPARYQHDCTYCTYLGHLGSDDLYVCTAPGSLIAREGNDGPEYLSMPIGSMYRAPQLQEAFERAVQYGVIVSTARDRVLLALFSPLGDDVRARNDLAHEAERQLTSAFDPSHWEVAEGLFEQGGYGLLYDLAKGKSILAAPAMRRAARKGVTDLAEFQAIVADPDTYLRDTEPAEYPHEPECSANGSRWSKVDECGPCTRILEDRERAEREALWQEYEKLEADPEGETARKLLRKIYRGPNTAPDLGR